MTTIRADVFVGGDPKVRVSSHANMATLYVDDLTFYAPSGGDRLTDLTALRDLARRMLTVTTEAILAARRAAADDTDDERASK